MGIIKGISRNIKLNLILSLVVCSKLSWGIDYTVDKNSGEKPSSLKDSIQTALKLNPKTASTDELLESIRYATKAVKATSLPSAGINCSINYQQSRIDSQSISNFDQKSRSQFCGISASYTLYDGGAAKYQYQSALASENATRASYNTTDALIPNTRGSLAYSTINAYIQLVKSRANIEFFKLIIDAMEAFKKIGPSDNLDALIEQISQGYQSYLDLEPVQVKSLSYLVRRTPSDNLETLRQTITKISIPETIDKAFDITLKNGPEVLRRDLSIQTAKNSLLAAKARLGPSVTLTAGIGRSRNSDISGQQDSSMTTNNVGLMFNLPLGVSSHYLVESAAHNLNAKKLEKDAAISDARESIETTYSLLDSEKRKYERVYQNYKEQEEKLKLILDLIQRGQTEDLIMSDLIDFIGYIVGQFQTMTQSEGSIITYQTSILQVTGLLFSEFIGEDDKSFEGSRSEIIIND